MLCFTASLVFHSYISPRLLLAWAARLYQVRNETADQEGTPPCVDDAETTSTLITLEPPLPTLFMRITPKTRVLTPTPLC